MDSSEDTLAVHPVGEIEKAQIGPLDFLINTPLLVDTAGGRYHVEWDQDAPLTPMGQLVFFAQFLKASELFSRLCADAPLEYESNNAHAKTDILGSFLLSILAGHYRYAHMTALRLDNVTPPLLGMKAMVSEDSARRALKRIDQAALRLCEIIGTYLNL